MLIIYRLLYMKIICKLCHKEYDIDETEYAPGEVVSIQCSRCGETTEAKIPQGKSEATVKPNIVNIDNEIVNIDKDIANIDNTVTPTATLSSILSSLLYAKQIQENDYDIIKEDEYNNVLSSSIKNKKANNKRKVQTSKPSASRKAAAPKSYSRADRISVENSSDKSGCGCTMMISYLLVLALGYFLISFLFGFWPFGKSSQEEQSADTVVAQIEEVQTESPESLLEKDVVNRLFKAIPDHGFNSANSYGNMTSELYDLIKEAFAIPLPYDGIGDEEFLYYFVSDQDGDCTDLQATVNISDNTHANAFVSTNLGNHTLVLVKEKDKWVLDDFDDRKSQIKDFISKKHRFFESGEYLKEKDSSTEWKRYESEVKDYMEKYNLESKNANSDQKIETEQAYAVSETDEATISHKSEPHNDDAVFVAVEQPAEFEGGMSALVDWLNNHTKYPEAARKNNIHGRVILKIIIEKDGSVTNPKIVRGVDPILDTEAIRVVKLMPKWEPARNNNIPVRSLYTLGVNFK